MLKCHVCGKRAKKKNVGIKSNEFLCDRCYKKLKDEIDAYHYAEHDLWDCEEEYYNKIDEIMQEQS